MAKSEQRLRARELRRVGKSIRSIAKKLEVSSSTASLWCRDILLTPAQEKALIRSTSEQIRLGQLRGAAAMRRAREARIIEARNDGLKKLQRLGRRERFVTGIALYLAEGAKTMRSVHFVNSDPRMIRFFLDWLKEFFDIDRSHVAPSLLINIVHKKRESRILDFWAHYLRIPRHQFRKTIFVRTLQKKKYENSNRYYGTMRFTVLKSTHLYYRIYGFMEGLLQHVPKPA